MAAKKISELSPASTLDGTELIVVVQGGATKKAALSQATAEVESKAAALDFWQRGSVDQAASRDRHRFGYEDAVEWTELWANLASWNVFEAGSLQVSAGQVFSATTATTMAGNRAFAVPAGGKGRVLGKITVPAATGGGLYSSGLVMIGVSGDATVPVTGGPSLAAVGVEGGSNQAFAFIKGAFVTGDQTQSVVPVGTYYVSVLIDDLVISLVLRSADGTVERRFQVTRSVFGAINHVQVWNSDIRGLTGIGVGAVGAKHDSSTLRTRTVEGLADPVGWTLRDSLPARVQLPAAYDSRRAAPVVLYVHGSGESGAGPFTDTLKRTMMQDIANDGFIVASTATTGTNDWGNQAALDQYLTLYRYVRDHYAIGPVVLLSQSMGGIPGLLTLAERRVPGIVGWAGIYPACNLAQIYNVAGDPYTLKVAIDAAYAISGDYAVKTAGHDPVLKSAGAFRGVPMRFYASPSDLVVNKATNADAIASLVAPVARESTVVACSGDHGDPSHFQSSDLRAFLARCIAA